MNIPNLFIIGAPKAGTTAFVNNISQHKDIFVPEQKEPRFFDAHTFYDYKEDYPIKSKKDYLKLFNSDEAKNAKYRVDGSVFNIYSEESIENILELSADAKFVIILREPVDASISMHRQRLTYADTKMREISENFMECWDKLGNRKEGKGYPQNCRNKFLFRYDLLYSYELYLPYIIQRIKKENLFIGFYDDFIKNPDEFYSNFFNFLYIEGIDIENKKINTSKILKKSKFLEYLDLFSKKTFYLRNKLGLSGKKINLIKTYIFNLYMDKNAKKQKADEKVYKYFQKTNEYLDKLRNSQ